MCAGCLELCVCCLECVCVCEFKTVYCTFIQYFVKNEFFGLEYWLRSTRHSADRMQRCITKVTNSFWTSSFKMSLLFTVSFFCLKPCPSVSSLTYLHLRHPQLFRLHSKLTHDMRYALAVFVYIAFSVGLIGLMSEVHCPCVVQAHILSLSPTFPVHCISPLENAYRK